MLYIVATPIGNLKDITFRAVEILKSVDLIACEDTRHTKILLEYYGISKPTTSFFQHNRFIKGEYLLNLLKEGKNIALVSDAGTPGILDPGYNLINLAIRNNIELTFIPGPTAFVNALVLSGKPTHEFIFAGFLPNRSLARQNRLKKLANLKQTIVFYESCHRILATLEDILAVFGDKEIVTARELTKKFEEVKRGPVKDILEELRRQKPRGEFVVVI
ncbi:MAG: 16S rRNA (cytidine(1402)-2'-O)-methyltransferase [Candidatus Omnitrophica bacterium CG08_land_8_20_14_0_20_41_16]|uniref:Ribosomal RNA small subunit methyltransferase I n=1 Tax=Candidatus Sherwoodlollariibacterium unditelluris TaxID=1974757 RepID=A0A2G9YKX5_9BACT|nr:MAG: 16S rRNA (cytidine(1402)-2'-O)-methyltransferase [Candidatus Omnitrophica bacterium CG23_combo_of_CG06-09_8_20_14_all_41_10]PIS33448.1 MAG: 16S rRNA (cytidine(1402)-2'-O)-methyltransferase [Candidatus Omnitrophica bacterium CG08_land_8_20_14_0_20_41_16]